MKSDHDKILEYVVGIVKEQRRANVRDWRRVCFADVNALLSGAGCEISEAMGWFWLQNAGHAGAWTVCADEDSLAIIVGDGPLLA